MNLQDLRTLLDYHYWARDCLLKALDGLSVEQYTRDLGNSFPSIRDTVVHIYSAEWAWHSRWLGTSPTALLSSEIFPDVGAIRTAWADLETSVRRFVESRGEDGLNGVMEYKLLNGRPGASVFWHMLQHVVNHASYHRGQITTMLRQVGAPVAESTDLIAFYRTRHP